jgi:RimJ/RimL family protein N-acetyltransferase
VIHIIGKKIELRAASNEDLDALYYWRFEEKEQEAKKWNGPYIPERWMTKKEFLKAWEQDQNILPSIPKLLVIRADDRVLGTVNAYWVDQNTNWLETGIVIYNKQYWNGGYGTEAYKMWIEYLFQKTNLHRLGMSTWSGNLRMMKVAEKLGFKEEARIRQARMVNGEYYDAIKMGILRNEWEQINQ